MYATAADLVAASDCVELQELDADVQDQLRLLAITAVESFCGQKFVQDVRARTLDGDGSRKLPLEVRLAAITALDVGAGSSLDLSDVAITDDRDALYVISDAGAGGTWASKVLREGRPPVFPVGTGTVKITGTWGWLDAEMPATATTPVGIAVRLDMEDMAKARRHGLASQIRAQSRLGVGGIGQGPLSVQQRDMPDVSLPLEAQEALADLIWQPIPVGG